MRHLDPGDAGAVHRDFSLLVMRRLQYRGRVWRGQDEIDILAVKTGHLGEANVGWVARVLSIEIIVDKVGWGKRHRHHAVSAHCVDAVHEE